ncbi:Fur family transcriptional regulator [Porticoccus sp. W117]|uniref:Fur family transcriptional regulator n=1 Tax=Porticoccus sp. W117 TaxID=3054777 RepID=UPI002598050C|nr:Fur family transcriptional regulator [Porticoccus sp. W117]MDM3870806.1 Fur family transcriptional regulator [Porticoccus sp. W117]
MITNSKLAYHEHDHQRCIDAAMARAVALCEEKKARLTQARKDVLTLIWQNHQPLGAYRIMDLLSEKNGKRVLPPTVYRALEFLLELGLIHRIASLNAYIGCPFPGSHHNELFLICRQCGSAAECSAEPVSNAIVNAATHANFQLESQSVELMGLCPQCQ